MTTEDVEDWMYQQLDNTTHLLHGVIHANGYGHLLRVNGREGGSRVLSGRHIMNFWDRLCRMLGVRLEYLLFSFCHSCSYNVCFFLFVQLWVFFFLVLYNVIVT